MKRKVFLTLLLALILVLSIVPVSAYEGQDVGDSTYVITSDITSYSELKPLAADYNRIIIQGSILTNDFSDFASIGDGLDDMPAIDVMQVSPHGEYPVNKLPAYDVVNGRFAPGKDTRITKGHSLAQDFMWTTTLKYVYSLDGNNSKNVTIDHEVIDANNVKMLQYATVVENAERRADNLIPLSVDPSTINNAEDVFVQYNDLFSANTNKGVRPYSVIRISKSYFYEVGAEFLSSVKLDLNPTVLGGFKIVKTDSTNDAKPLPGAKFKVYTDASCTTETEATRYDAGTDSWVAVGEVTTGRDGTVTVTNLRAGTYYVKETEAPAHYIIDDVNAKTVTVTAPAISFSLTGGEGTTAANIDADTVTLTSEWKALGVIASETKPLPFNKSVASSTKNASEYGGDVFIKGGGNTVAVASNGDVDLATLEGTYTDLRGSKYKVTVGNTVAGTFDTVSEAVQYVNNTLIVNGVIDSEGYRNHVTIAPTLSETLFTPKAGADVATVTFTDTATIDFTVNKSWINESLPQRGEYIQVQLYKILAGTEDPGSPWGDPVELNEDNNWSYTWTDLDPNADYKVEEVEIPVGYELVDTEYEVGKTEDGRIRITAEMTNSQIVDVEVNKSWFNDTPAQRGEYLIVQLYCDGEPYGDPIELTEKEGWSYRWEGLEGGHKYTVDEPQVPADYVKKIVDPKAGVDEETGRVLITCEISNTHADSPITFDDSTILICLSVALMIAVAYLAIKIKQTPTK